MTWLLRATADRLLFVTTLLLVIFGVLMVYSASSVLAAEKFGDQLYFLKRQSLWALVGLGGMFVAANVDYHLYEKPWIVYLGLFASMVMLIAVFFMPEVNHAHRWLRWRAISFQPAEAARLSLMIFLASYLSRRMARGMDDVWRTVVPCAVVTGALMLLIVLEPDLGMAMSMGGILLIALFVAGVPLRHMAALLLAGLPVLYYFLFHVSWRMERLLVFLDPWRDPLGRGFQSIQSMIAIGSGGIWGRGFAQGKQKLFYLPEPHTDFIFAQTGEELGFIGLLALLVAFGLLLWRGVRAGLRAPESFGTLLGVTLTIALVGQALFNMSMTLGLAPVKGMPLPLVSYGGSSLVLSLVEIGIVLNIAQHGRAYAA